MVKQLVAATLVMAIVACAGAKRQAPSPAVAPRETAPAAAVEPRPVSPMPGDPRTEIEELSQAIEARRADLGLAEPPPVASPGPATPMATIPSSTDATCRPAKTERCTSSCTLSDSICKNAARICELASQLEGDAWAANKCTRAKQTCTAAHDTCCSCQ